MAGDALDLCPQRMISLSVFFSMKIGEKYEAVNIILYLWRVFVFFPVLPMSAALKPATGQAIEQSR